MHKPRHNAQSTLARASLGGHARSDEVRRPGTVHGMCTEGPRQVGSNLTKPAAMWAGFRNFVTTATRSIHEIDLGSTFKEIRPPRRAVHEFSRAAGCPKPSFPSLPGWQPHERGGGMNTESEQEASETTMMDMEIRPRQVHSYVDRVRGPPIVYI